MIIHSALCKDLNEKLPSVKLRTFFKESSEPLAEWRNAMPESFQVFPVGVVGKKEDAAWIEIFEPYCDALLGLEGFSHIQVFFWFHENDTPEQRKTLRVHPRNDKIDSGTAHRNRKN
jgi:tRNA (Thr-GGU) A37 N-methylase